MSYDYRESQLQEIAEQGIYWMANSKLATQYTEELCRRGYDAHVIHGLGDSGVKDVIFLSSRSVEIKKLLLNRKNNVTHQLSVLDEALRELDNIIHG